MILPTATCPITILPATCASGTVAAMSKVASGHVAPAESEAGMARKGARKPVRDLEEEELSAAMSDSVKGLRLDRLVSRAVWRDMQRRKGLGEESLKSTAIISGPLQRKEDLNESNRTGDARMSIQDSVDDMISRLKDVRMVSQKFRDAEFQVMIAELLLEAANLKMEAVDLREDNNHLHRQVKYLQHKDSLRTKLEWRDGHYYLTKPLKGYGPGPFCVVCFDGDGPLMLLQPVHGPDAQTQDAWKCNRCGNQTPCQPNQP